MQSDVARAAIEGTPNRGADVRRQTLGVVFRRVVRSVMTHPLTMAAKAPIKDVLWTMRGRGLRNPPFGREVRSVLFLCHGNICRSPFASERAAQLLARAGIRDVYCASAGIAANQANECPSDARAAAEVFGVHLDVHTPTLLTPAMMDEFELIVVMEAAQLRLLRERFEHAGSRLVLLSLLDGANRGGYARYNIADPFGQPRTAFDACYDRIDRSLQSLIHTLSTSRLQPAAERPATTR